MYTLKQMTEARNLVGTDINELEYIDHIVIQDSKTYFQIIHLDGSEKLIEIKELLKTKKYLKR